jgi:glycosyltransferase involved in cell wall biosynthesis
MPTSVLEAVACKAFVVTSSAGGAKELLNSQDLGIVLDACTQQHVAQSLLLACTDSEYRQRATQRAHQRLSEGFTWDVTANNVKSAIAELKTEEL